MYLLVCGSFEPGPMLFFFFKQKTAYELRISDWSSDVCSSDLALALDRAEPDPERAAGIAVRHRVIAPARREHAVVPNAVIEDQRLIGHALAIGARQHQPIEMPHLAGGGSVQRFLPVQFGAISRLVAARTGTRRVRKAGDVARID